MRILGESNGMLRVETPEGERLMTQKEYDKAIGKVVSTDEVTAEIDVAELPAFKELEKKVTKLEGDLTKANDKVAKLEGEAKTAGEAKTKLEGDLTKANDKVAKLEGEAKTAGEAKTKLEGDLTKANDKVAKLEADIAKLKAK